MSNTMFPGLASLRIELSDEVRDAQFQAIVAALDQIPESGPAVVPRWKTAWRRWAVSVAALGTALVPVAAIASDSAVPGDLLYPVKLTVERIQIIFDRDIDAEHRVSELENLIDRQADPLVIERHIAQTAAVLGDTFDREDLIERFDDAVSDHGGQIDDVPDIGLIPRRKTEDAVGSDSTAPHHITDETTTTSTRESDRQSTTDDRTSEFDSTSETTVAGDDVEHPTSTHRSDETSSTTEAGDGDADSTGDGSRDDQP